MIRFEEKAWGKGAGRSSQVPIKMVAQHLKFVASGENTGFSINNGAVSEGVT